MQMQVGEFRFDVDPGHAEYTELTRRRARRWASRERYGMPAQLEDLGRDAERIDVRGTIWVQTVEDLLALDPIKTQAGLPGDEAQPLPVFRGGNGAESGEYLGMWVVVSLNEREQILRADGVPTQIDFLMTLMEFVP